MTPDEITKIVATSTISEPIALILGLIPNRAAEKTFMGSVVDPGPATKLVITKSSIDSEKDNNQPEISAGAIMGNTITKNTLNG